MKTLNQIAQAALARIFSMKNVTGLSFVEGEFDVNKALNPSLHSCYSRGEILYKAYGLELGLLAIKDNKKNNTFYENLLQYKEQFTERNIPSHVIEILTGYEDGEFIATAYAYRLTETQRSLLRKAIK